MFTDKYFFQGKKENAAWGAQSQGHPSCGSVLCDLMQVLCLSNSASPPANTGANTVLQHLQMKI